jgi:hypothetical protein
MSLGHAWDEGRQAWNRLCRHPDGPGDGDRALIALSDIGTVRRAMEPAGCKPPDDIASPGRRLPSARVTPIRWSDGATSTNARRHHGGRRSRVIRIHLVKRHTLNQAGLPCMPFRKRAVAPQDVVSVNLVPEPRSSGSGVRLWLDGGGAVRERRPADADAVSRDAA